MRKAFSNPLVAHWLQSLPNSVGPEDPVELRARLKGPFGASHRRPESWSSRLILEPVRGRSRRTADYR